MKQNISLVDALIRITIGLVILAWTGSKCANRHHRFPIIAGLVGAMKVAEGVTRFCPIIYVAQKREDEISHKQVNVTNPS